MIFLVPLAVLVLYSPAPGYSHIYSKACSYAALAREMTAIRWQQQSCAKLFRSSKGKITDGPNVPEQDLRPKFEQALQISTALTYGCLFLSAPAFSRAEHPAPFARAGPGDIQHL